MTTPPADPALNPDADSERDRITCAQAAGMLIAVKALEPTWAGFKASIVDFLEWQSHHQPRG